MEHARVSKKCSRAQPASREASRPAGMAAGFVSADCSPALLLESQPGKLSALRWLRLCRCQYVHQPLDFRSPGLSMGEEGSRPARAELVRTPSSQKPRSQQSEDALHPIKLRFLTLRG